MNDTLEETTTLWALDFDETDEDRYQRATNDPDRWHTQQKEEW
jgi:hypothetical protein